VLKALREGQQNATLLAARFGVSPRTVYRDIGLLRQKGYSIDYNEVTHTFTLTEPDLPLFGGVHLSEDDRYALEMAAVFLKGHGGAFSKVAATLEALSRRAGGGSLTLPEEAFSIHAGEALEESTLKQLIAALVVQRTVAFQYEPLDGTAGHREVAPYQVFFREGAWYLFGLNLEKGVTRFYRLSRIRGLELGDEGFEFPKGLSLQSIFEETFLVYRGGEPCEVILEFTDPVWARYVLGIRWHSSQKILKKGVPARLSLTVPITPELERFVLGFGEHSRVIEPAELAARITERHRKATACSKWP
jgi:predicted DNA-binding transcriptional regulator YafY